MENLAFACSGCNKYKSHRISGLDEDTGIEAAFYNPRTDVWNEHFIWSEDFIELIGLTAKGRITIKELKLNRQSIRNLRRILVIADEHPPKSSD